MARAHDQRSAPPSHWARGLHEGLAVALTLALLVSIVAWPALVDPSGQVVGGGQGDFAGIAWGLWRVARALPGLPETHVADVLFPEGATLLVADLPESLLLAPLTLTLGPVVAFNLWQVAHPALAGAGAWLVARDEGLGRTAAATAAVAFGFCNVLLTGAHNGNPDVTPLFLIPLAVLAARGVAGGRRPAVALGLIVGSAAWFNPYVAVMVGLSALPWLPLAPRAGGPNPLGALVLALGVAVMVGGAYVELVAETLQGPGSMVKKGGVAPPGVGVAWLSGYLWPTLDQSKDGWSLHGWYLGQSVVALASLGLLRPKICRNSVGNGELIRWAALALVGAVLAMGAALQWGPSPLRIGGSPIWMPGGWLQRLPGFDALHISYRFAALTALAAALLAARGVDRLPLRWRVLAPVVVLFDLLLPGHGWNLLQAGPAPAQPACALLDGLDEGAILDIPGTHTELRLYAQTCHGRAVAEGINRPYSGLASKALRTGQADGLRAAGFRFVVLHEPNDAVLAWGTVAATDGSVTVIELP